MYCKPCYYTSRIRREGGEFALCWQHKKRKCYYCRKISGGKLYCTECEHKEDIARWKGESNPIYYDEDHEFFNMQLRKERLMEAKFHMHRAVEVAFRALVLSVEAIWGGFKKEPVEKRDKKKETLPPEFKEAA